MGATDGATHASAREKETWEVKFDRPWVHYTTAGQKKKRFKGNIPTQESGGVQLTSAYMALRTQDESIQPAPL